MTQREFLLDVLRSDWAAVDFVETVGRLSQVWDDVVDGDISEDQIPETVNNMMHTALFVLPNNPFYRQNFVALNPMMQMIVNDWHDANALERGTRHDRTVAFVLRDRLASLVVQCASIVGGEAWARTVGPRIRRYFFDETLDQYLEGLP